MSIEFQTKRERLLSLMDREGFSGVVLIAQRNFSWISGGASNMVDGSGEYGVASMLVTRDGKCRVLTNNIEGSRIADEVIAGKGIEVIEREWLDEHKDPAILLNAAKSIAGGTIATDLPLHGTDAVIEHLIAPLRWELTPAEVERYASLGTDAGIALRSVFDEVKPGDSEVEIAARMKFELARFAIDSIVTLVAADERIDKYRHPVPTEKKWNKTLMLVTCARRNGLVASLTRIGTIGKASVDLISRTNSAARVYSAILARTRPGTSSGEIFEAAIQEYDRAGFADEIRLHHQGGAAGYRTREWVASPGGSNVVVADQAFAWNPSITGTKVEETVVVNSAGSIRTLTVSPDFPLIRNTVNGVDYEVSGILEDL